MKIAAKEIAITPIKSAAIATKFSSSKSGFGNCNDFSILGKYPRFETFNMYDIASFLNEQFAAPD